MLKNYALSRWGLRTYGSGPTPARKSLIGKHLGPIIKLKITIIVPMSSKIVKK